MKTPNLRAFSALALFAALAACSDGSSGGGGGGNPGFEPDMAVGRFLFRDSTADQLLSFAVQIESMRGRYADGSATDELLTSPVVVEVLGLDESSLWLCQAEIEPGTLVAIELEFNPFAYVSRDLTGAPVVITSLGDTLIAPLLRDTDVPDEGILTFEVHLDLVKGLSGNPAPGVVNFEPRGEAIPMPGMTDVCTEELDGLVTKKESGDNQVLLEGYVDDEREIPMGEVPVPVTVDGNTLFLDRLGNQLSHSSFFSKLERNKTVTEIHGKLDPEGDLLAERIEIEEQNGITGDTFPIKIDGRITEVAAGLLRMRVQEIEKGVPFAGPVLIGGGDPLEIEVDLDDPRLRVMNGNALVAAAFLRVGQEIKVKFEEFSSEPYPAVRIDAEEPDERTFGELFSVNGLPNSFIMHVRSDEPAIQAGLIDSDMTDVTVQLVPSTEIVLGTLGRPMLTDNLLVDGTEIKVNGPISGPSNAPTIVARRVKIIPGLLKDAEVSNLMLAQGGMETLGGEIIGTFGNDVFPGPLWNIVNSQALFYGAAKSGNEFIGVFNNLGPGERLIVDVRGIGLGGVMEINAFEIFTRVVP